jgi:hypothetical protein
MYPHIEQAAEVCAEEAERFLIEGFELAPTYPARLQAAVEGIRVRACFLGHRSCSAGDLASYRGPKPSTRRRPPARNSTRRPPGFDTGAISCANSAVRKDCPTSTWAHTAQAEHCAMETCGGSFGYLARSMSQHRGVHGSVG